MLFRTDPIPKFRFALQVTGVTVGWFTECNGLSMEREAIPRPEGGVNDYVHQLPGRAKQSKITLKRGLADNVLWVWFQQGLYDGKVQRLNISIVLYNSTRTLKKQWNLSDAYPVKWSGPELQADNNQAAIETLELVHHGMSMMEWMPAFL